MPINVVLGEQRGDEGKGRFVDLLAEEHDIVARFNGGPNAGHTIVLPNQKVLGLHVVPSGIAHDHTQNVIGNGTVIDPQKLIHEIADIREKGIEVSPDNLKISHLAHVILPHHISADEIRESGEMSQGSTKCGIAPVSADKYARRGIQMGHFITHTDDVIELTSAILHEQANEREQVGLPPLDIKEQIEYLPQAAEILGKYVIDSVLFLNRKLDEGSNILAEGAQAFWLDIDHGMYPYVTSSHTTTGGVLTGLGVGPKSIERIIGVSKLIPSHVGDGAFVTEIKDPELLAQLHGDLSAVDAETGTTTGRVRRLGHLDLPKLKRANMVHGTTEIAATKLDWLPRYGERILMCVAYEFRGEIIDIAPSTNDELQDCKPIYEAFPAWSPDIDITRVRSFPELPIEVQDIVLAIESHTRKPVNMIGVGPGRDEVIIRKH